MALSPKEANILNNPELIKYYEEKIDSFLSENYKGKPINFYYKTSDNLNVSIIKMIYEKVGWKVKDEFDSREGDSLLNFSENKDFKP